MKGKGYKISMVLLASLMSINLLTACGKGGGQENNNTQNQGQTQEKGTISGTDNISIEELSKFDPLEGVTAKDSEGKDITANIEVKGEVDTLKPGEYKLTYTLKGTKVSVTRTVTVTSVQAALANGTYNFKFAKAELRNHLVETAEDYLLHNQLGGVPLFSDAGYALYSSRVQLASQECLPVLGYGTVYSTMSADDSTVLMEDGKKGKKGEYTYRIAIGQNPSQWNQWIQEDQTSSDLMEYYYGSLYTYDFNKDKTGYVLNPSMAAEDPKAIESRELKNGKTVAKKWQIKIKDGLKWKFNPNTDISMIKDTTINAVDYYETYKLALEKKWFRAISGGGDFCTSSMAVVNGEEFINGKAKWEDVGIKLIDDNTIELQFVHEQSQWKVKYFLSSNTMSPVQTELYKALGDKYGTNEKTIAYHGPYYVDYYENDKVIRLNKNDQYHEPNKYFYTNRLVTIVSEAEVRFQEFVAGKLDTVVLPATHYEEYKSHPSLKHIPGDTVFKININGLGTQEKQIAKFPDSKWVPQPILSNQDFKMGIFHAMDRKKLATEVMKTSQPSMYIFSEAYVVEAEEGIPYRNTEAGKAVALDLSPSTHGYNLDAAKAYFDKALDTLVGEGVYKSGDEIKIGFNYQSGSETQALMASYIKDAMEAAFNSKKHNIKVTVETSPKEFPAIYNDYIMIGEFDTSIGGIGGNTLDAAGFLDVFCTDNRSGFTLNWGVDTSVPEINVSYEKDDGNLVKELWSYDALVSALSGEIKVVEGKEVKGK